MYASLLIIENWMDSNENIEKIGHRERHIIIKYILSKKKYIRTHSIDRGVPECSATIISRWWRPSSRAHIIISCGQICAKRSASHYGVTVASFYPDVSVTSSLFIRTALSKDSCSIQCRHIHLNISSPTTSCFKQKLIFTQIKKKELQGSFDIYFLFVFIEFSKKDGVALPSMVCETQASSIIHRMSHLKSSPAMVSNLSV